MQVYLPGDASGVAGSQESPAASGSPHDGSTRTTLLDSQVTPTEGESSPSLPPPAAETEPLITTDVLETRLHCIGMLAITAIRHQ